MFILLDPIFWINKTLATFDRMVAKLQKQIEKVDKELNDNIVVRSTITSTATDKTTKVSAKAEKKLEKINAKAYTKKTKISDKANARINMIRARDRALQEARRRAENTAKNINKLMGE